MAYFLTVTHGTDKGKSFPVESGACIIGRSPSSTVVLHDDSVAWEHAVVRETAGRLVLQNLSALGTRVKGRRVGQEMRLGASDEIQLSDRCRIQVQQRIADTHGLSRLSILLIAAITAIVVIGGAFVMLFELPDPPPPPPNAGNWRTAYHRIDERLGRWSEDGSFPIDGHILFREAWRLEQVGNSSAAGAKWNGLRSLLLVVPVPGASDDRMIAQSASASPRSLKVIMGMDPTITGTEFEWNTDETYADALAWFVKHRAEITNPPAEKPS